MAKIDQFFFLLGAIILTSCSTTKLLTSTVRPNDINDLQKFETLSYITLIEKANKGTYNEELSNESKKMFSNALKSFENRIHLKGEMSIDDSFTKKRIEKEIEYLCVTAERQKSISNLRLTPTLDSLLEANQNRFGLVTVTTGFTRIKGNYGKQIAKGIGLGVLTMGMFYTTPVKSHSAVYAMIIDSKDNNIAFFRKSLLADKEPLNETVLRKQILDIFSGYYWAKN